MIEFTNVAEARAYITSVFRRGQGVTDFIGMSSPGGGEQPKGFFASGDQTELGYIDTANRIQRNVATFDNAQAHKARVAEEMGLSL